MRLIVIFSLPIAVILGLLFGSQAIAQPKLTKADINSAIAAPSLNEALAIFLPKLPQVVIPEQGNAVYYVLEGDLLLNHEGVESYLMSHRQGIVPARDGELLVMTQMGKKVIWQSGQRNLTYAVARNTFPTQTQYQEVVNNMREAANDWLFCAECGLTIKHQEKFDANPKPGEVTFIVRYVPNETDFIAAAFFPNYPPAMRQVFIAPSYFTTTANHVGVLRHELGHVLGYRHEHIVGIPGCALEDGNWVPVTPYDSHSVMHYLCGDGGTMTMALQETDKAGHRIAYGE